MRGENIKSLKNLKIKLQLSLIFNKWQTDIITIKKSSNQNFSISPKRQWKLSSDSFVPVTMENLHLHFWFPPFSPISSNNFFLRCACAHRGKLKYFSILSFFFWFFFFLFFKWIFKRMEKLFFGCLYELLRPFRFNFFRILKQQN